MGRNSLIYYVRRTIYNAHNYAAYNVTTGIWYGLKHKYSSGNLNIYLESIEQIVSHCNQTFVNKGNQKENHSRQSQVYPTGDEVLFNNAWLINFDQDAYIGPHAVTVIYNNKSVQRCRCNVPDACNLCNIIPSKE